MRLGKGSFGPLAHYESAKNDLELQSSDIVLAVAKKDQGNGPSKGQVRLPACSPGAVEGNQAARIDAQPQRALR